MDLSYDVQALAHISSRRNGRKIDGKIDTIKSEQPKTAPLALNEIIVVDGEMRCGAHKWKMVLHKKLKYPRV